MKPAARRVAGADPEPLRHPSPGAEDRHSDHPGFIRNGDILPTNTWAALGSVRLLKDEFATRGIKSKSWTIASGRRIGGKPFSRGALYLILQNRLYRGEIV